MPAGSKKERVYKEYDLSGKNFIFSPPLPTADPSYLS